MPPPTLNSEEPTNCWRPAPAPLGSLGDASHPSLPRAESSVIGSTVVYLETSNEDGVHTIFRWSVLGRCH